jgi:hypothetical protein
MKMVKACLLMILGIFMVGVFIAIIIGWAYSSDRYESENKSNWPITQGKVINIEAKQDIDDDTPISKMFSSEDWFVTASFVYEVEGVQYSGSQNWYESKTEAEKGILTYSPGSIINVYYNPDSPGTSVIEPTKVAFTWADYIWALLLVGFLFLGGGISVIFAALDRFKNRNITS